MLTSVGPTPMISSPIFANALNATKSTEHPLCDQSTSQGLLLLEVLDECLVGVNRPEDYLALSHVWGTQGSLQCYSL